MTFAQTLTDKNLSVLYPDLICMGIASLLDLKRQFEKRCNSYAGCDREKRFEELVEKNGLSYSQVTDFIALLANPEWLFQLRREKGESNMIHFDDSSFSVACF